MLKPLPSGIRYVHRKYASKRLSIPFPPPTPRYTETERWADHCRDCVPLRPPTEGSGCSPFDRLRLAPIGRRGCKDATRTMMMLTLPTLGYTVSATKEVAERRTAHIPAVISAYASLQWSGMLWPVPAALYKRQRAPEALHTKRCLM